MATTEAHRAQIVNFIEYDTVTGEIYSSGNRPREDFVLPLPTKNDTTIVETDVYVDPNLAYIVDSQLVVRPILPEFNKTSITADGMDTATLDLPEPMIVLIDGVEYGPTNKVELASDMPASYKLLIKHFPYQDYIVAIEVL